MIVDLDRYVKFLEKHGITAEQFLLPYCLWLERLEKAKGGYLPISGEVRSRATMYRYAVRVKPWSLQDYEVLRDKGFIILNKVPETANIYEDDIEVTPHFINLMSVTEDQFEEFWEAFPWSTEGEHTYPLKGASYDETRKLYNATVRTDALHNRVMRALQYAVKHQVMLMKITTWIESRQWEGIEKLMTDDSVARPRGQVV